jgi:microcystin-dependent protein
VACYVGEIRAFGTQFVPSGWVECDGRELPRTTYSDLFSAIGLAYGGGITTFRVPDLRRRVPIHAGVGPGLTSRNLGDMGGTQTVGLTAATLPLHSHTTNACSNPKVVSGVPVVDNSLCKTNAPAYAPSISVHNTALDASVIGPTGESLPHDNMMPYVELRFCIALQGDIP